MRDLFLSSRARIAAAALLTLFAAAGTPAAQEVPGLAGAVLAGPDQPLAGARVELVPVPSLYEAGRLRIDTGGGPEPAAAVATGPDGRFRLAVPRQGSWKVVVRSSGRVPLQYGPLLWVGPGIELPAAVPPRSVDVPVAVRDGAGRPVPDAWVLATDAEETLAARRTGLWKIEPRAVRTGPDGTATLPGIEGRPLEIHVLASGRGEEIRQGFTGGTVSLAEASQPVVLGVESAGRPAAGVQVRTGGINWPFGHTDRQGEIRLPVPVTQAGTQAPRLRLLTSDGRQKVARLTLEPDKTLRLTLGEPKVLPGRVVDEATGKGLSGAFLSPDTDPGAVLKTDAEGRYRLTLPGPGPLTLEARAPGYLAKRLAVSPGDAKAGRVPSLSLERATSVEGIVLDASRKPLPGVLIEAAPRSVLGSRQLSPREPVADRTVTDEAGRFTLRRLRATETYEIRARRAGLLPAAQLVPVPAGGLSAKRRVQLQIHPSRPAQGQVVDAQGQPVAGARVVLRPAARPGFPALDPRAEADLPEDDPARAKSGEQGRFQVEACPAGEFDAEVTRAGFAPAYRRGVQAIGGKGPVDLGTIALAPGARLAGRVVDNRSQPVPEAEIFLLAAPPRGFDPEDSVRERKPQASSGPDGRFEIADLPKGIPHYLVTRAAGYLPSVLSSVRAPLKEPLVVRLQRGAPLAGRVVDQAGKPVEEARVELTWLAVLEVSPNRRPVGNPVTREAVTDADGRFELRNCPEGSVTLDVTAQGFLKLSEVEAAVPWKDPDKELVLVLKRGASLSGRITTTAGEPVAQARITARGELRAERRRRGLPHRRDPGRPPGSRHRPPGLPPPAAQDRGRAGRERPGLRLQARHRGLRPHRGRGRRAGVRSPGPAEGRGPLGPAAVRSGERRGWTLPCGLSRRASTASRRKPASRGAPRTARPCRWPRSRWPGSRSCCGPAPCCPAKCWGSRRRSWPRWRSRPARTAAGLPARLSSEGNYEIRGLEAGDWVVQAVLWQGQRQTQARVPIAPGDREVTRDLDFGPRASLSGRVLFNGDPLPDAVLSVRAERVVHTRTVRTDFAGGFRIDDLEPDRYSLAASAIPSSS